MYVSLTPLYPPLPPRKLTVVGVTASFVQTPLIGVAFAAAPECPAPYISSIVRNKLCSVQVCVSIPVFIIGPHKSSESYSAPHVHPHQT